MIGQVVVFETKNQATLKEFTIPKLKQQEVLIKTDFSVISAGTEIANF